MKTLENIAIGATSVLGSVRTGGPACSRLTVPPVLTGQGTGLPIGTTEGRRSAMSSFDKTRPSFAATGLRLGAFAGVTGADQIEPVRTASTAGSDDRWDPPRRTPPRC